MIHAGVPGHFSRGRGEFFYTFYYILKVIYSLDYFKKKKSEKSDLPVQTYLFKQCTYNAQHNTLYYSVVIIYRWIIIILYLLIHRLRFSAVIINFRGTITGRSTVTCVGPRMNRSKLIRSEEFSMTPCNRLRTASFSLADTRTNDTRSLPWIPRSAKTLKIK